MGGQLGLAVRATQRAGSLLPILEAIPEGCLYISLCKPGTAGLWGQWSLSSISKQESSAPRRAVRERELPRTPACLRLSASSLEYVCVCAHTLEVASHVSSHIFLVAQARPSHSLDPPFISIPEVQLAPQPRTGFR